MSGALQPDTCGFLLIACGLPMAILVHDYLLVRRGAERSFLAMCDLYPNAPIATLFYDPALFSDRLLGREVSTSRLQAVAGAQRRFRAALPLLPREVERLPVEGHELVLSSSSAFAHGVRPGKGATHVCYCYTPFRYAWYEEARGLGEAPRLARPFLKRTLRRIRAWDLDAAQRATHYVAISRLSQQRIAKYWGRYAPIVHPPVELERFRPWTAEDFFLIVSELVKHKRVDFALEAAQSASVPIKVVGEGPDGPRLRHKYGRGVEFLGRVDDTLLAELYGRCRALVVPSIEEFGIAAVEAQAAGRPVIAAGGGGARETVVDGETGILVPPGDPGALAAALCSEALDDIDPKAARKNAERFSIAEFRRGLTEQIEDACESREVIHAQRT